MIVLGLAQRDALSSSVYQATSVLIAQAESGCLWVSAHLFNVLITACSRRGCHGFQPQLAGESLTGDFWHEAIRALLYDGPSQATVAMVSVVRVVLL